jgi:hypothetical protein
VVGRAGGAGGGCRRGCGLCSAAEHEAPVRSSGACISRVPAEPQLQVGTLCSSCIAAWASGWEHLPSLCMTVLHCKVYGDCVQLALPLSMTLLWNCQTSCNIVLQPRVVLQGWCLVTAASWLQKAAAACAGGPAGGGGAGGVWAVLRPLAALWPAACGELPTASNTVTVSCRCRV